MKLLQPNWVVLMSTSWECIQVRFPLMGSRYVDPEWKHPNPWRLELRYLYYDFFHICQQTREDHVYRRNGYISLWLQWGMEVLRCFPGFGSPLAWPILFLKRFQASCPQHILLETYCSSVLEPRPDEAHNPFAFCEPQWLCEPDVFQMDRCSSSSSGASTRDIRNSSCSTKPGGQWHPRALLPKAAVRKVRSWQILKQVT